MVPHLLGQIIRTTRMPKNETNYLLHPTWLLLLLLHLLLHDHSRLLIMLMLMSPDLHKRSWTRPFKWFFKPKRAKKNHHSLKISSSPSSLTSIVVRFGRNGITSVNKVRTILPPLALFVLIKFRFQLFSFEMKSTSASSNTSGG